MSMSLKDVMRHTDWEELRLQKADLAAAAIERPGLDGLLNWIDAVQDAVVGEGIVDAEIVFPCLED